MEGKKGENLKLHARRFLLSVQWYNWDEILRVAISAAGVDCLLNTLCCKVKDQGLYLEI